MPQAPPEIYGLGLLHVSSKTCALDIDDLPAARALLAEQDIDLDALLNSPDAVRIESGKPGRAKLIYRLDSPLATKKVVRDGHTILELRCATAAGDNVQDVLPPSVHPETLQPYQWVGQGTIAALAPIPQALTTYWQNLLAGESHEVVAVGNVKAGWAEISSALTAITPSCSRAEWIKVGMSLKMIAHHSNEDAVGLELFNQWSSGSPDKYKANEILPQWRSFRTDFAEGIGVGSLFYLAREHGWVRPAPDIRALFQNVEATITPAEMIESRSSYVPRIDMDLIPRPLADRAVELSTRVGCESVIPVWAGLAAASAAADARSRLELAPGYQVPPIIWLITLGDPAAKKSPGSKPMFEVLHDIEREAGPAYKVELSKWEAVEASHSAAKKAYLAQAAHPLNMLGNGQVDMSALPDVFDLAPKPEPKRLVVGDVTSQKLIDLVSDRPYGMLANYDELGATLKKMTDPRGSENRGTWIAGYEADRYLLDRVGTGTTICDTFGVSIYGNCQPAVLASFSKEAATDGLLQRFLFAPIKQENRTGRPTSHNPAIAAAYEAAIRNIHAAGKMNYRLSPDGAELFSQFQARYCQTINDDRCLNMGNTYLGAIGKLEGNCGRLIFLFHLLDNPHQQEVSIETVKRAIAFTEGYIVNSLRFVLAEEDFRSDILNYLSSYIVTTDRDVFDMSMIRQDIRTRLEIGANKLSSRDIDDEVVPIVRTLIDSGWLSQIEDKPPRWAINPAIREKYADYRNRLLRIRNERHQMLMLDLRKNYPESESIRRRLEIVLDQAAKIP